MAGVEVLEQARLNRLPLQELPRSENARGPFTPWPDIHPGWMAQQELKFPRRCG